MIKIADKNALRIKKHQRIRNKINGTPEMLRLCVYRSNKHIEAQLIDDTKAITLASVSSVSLKLDRGNNVAAATKVGEEIAKKCLELNITKVVFDRAGYIYHGRVKALAEAARSGGLKF